MTIENGASAANDTALPEAAAAAAALNQLEEQ
jgi:hypothetical protein